MGDKDRPQSAGRDTARRVGCLYRFRDLLVVEKESLYTGNGIYHGLGTWQAAAYAVALTW
jgi:hypothetical protein